MKYGFRYPAKAPGVKWLTKQILLPHFPRIIGTQGGEHNAKVDESCRPVKWWINEFMDEKPPLFAYVMDKRDVMRLSSAKILMSKHPELLGNGIHHHHSWSGWRNKSWKNLPPFGRWLPRCCTFRPSWCSRRCPRRTIGMPLEKGDN